MSPPASGSSSARAMEVGDDSGAWTVLRLILWSAEYLGARGVARARLDAEYLLGHALGVERLQLYLQYDRPLTPAELDGYRPLLRRRARREPLQYILGRQAFRELDLEVGRAVLIPRPETEVLVEEVLGWAQRMGRPGLAALDLGTGSGAIALSLAREGPFARVVATDVAGEALEVAQRNRVAADLGDVVELRLGAFFEPLADDERFDVVVSNPPYVADAEREDLEPEVGDWEPGEALFGGGPDGMDSLRRIVREVGGFVRPSGLVALEVGMTQAGEVAALLEATRQYDEVRVKRDLSGRERIVLATRAAAPGSEPT